jgi:hypothetical protein
MPTEGTDLIYEGITTNSTRFNIKFLGYLKELTWFTKGLRRFVNTRCFVVLNIFWKELTWFTKGLRPTVPSPLPVGRGKELTWFTKGLRHLWYNPAFAGSRCEGTDLIYEGITTWRTTIKKQRLFAEEGTDLIYEGITTGTVKHIRG